MTTVAPSHSSSPSPGVEAAKAAQHWSPEQRARAEKVADKRIMSARVRLLLSNGFYGTLATRLSYVVDWSQPTAWTDTIRMGYNPAYVNALTADQVEGLIAHEVTHCALGHVWRREDREPERWNTAADYVVDGELEASGLIVPDPAINPDFFGLSAEVIYARLQPPPGGGEGKEKQDGGGNGGDSGQSDQSDSDDSPATPEDGAGQGQEPEPGQDSPQGQNPPPGQPEPGQGEQQGQGQASGQVGAPGARAWDGYTKGEVRDLPDQDLKAEKEAEWRIATVQAAKAAKSRGDAPGWVSAYLEDLAQPRVNWIAELRQFMQQVARADYSWRRPNPRYGDVYLPRLHSEQMPPVVIAIDTSGSMWTQEILEQLGGELGAIMGEVKPERVDVLYIDTRVTSVQQYEPGDDLRFEPKGGGGTDFRPAFDWVEQQEDQPACLIYLTDMYGSFPKSEPDYPVLWGVLTEDRYESPNAPFGTEVPICLR